MLSRRRIYCRRKLISAWSPAISRSLVWRRPHLQKAVVIFHYKVNLYKHGMIFGRNTQGACQLSQSLWDDLPLQYQM